jgi:hypothetical protein
MLFSPDDTYDVSGNSPVAVFDDGILIELTMNLTFIEGDILIPIISPSYTTLILSRITFSKVCVDDAIIDQSVSSNASK